MKPSFKPRGILSGLVVVAGYCTVTGNIYGRDKKETPPNIIYILADDLGYGDLSCYGQKRFTTPNLDKMAGEGMRFMQHYAGSTVSAPSRASLMTGLHTGHCPIRGNREVQPEGQMPLPANIPTVAGLLQTAGYNTACIGKWGLGYPGSEGEPNKKGFDYFFGYNCQREAHHYYPDHLWRNNQRIEYPSNKKELKQGEFSHDLFTAEALQFIQKNTTEPFFLYLTYTLPHADMDVPEDSMKEFIGLYDEKPFGGGGYIKQDNPAAAFAGMLKRLDGDVGRILELLKTLGIDKNTLVIFTSDNGPHSEGGHRPDYFNSSGGLRGIKRDMYEGGIRVPFIAWWPGTVKSGTESRHISAFWDFMPTACELAKVSPPKNTDGISYLSTLKGQTQKNHKYLYWELYEGAEKQALLKPPYKLVRIRDNAQSDYRYELYNLEEDITESKNISESIPKITTKMKSEIEKIRIPL